MKLKKGLKFKTTFGNDNINNKPFNEVRAIVDNEVIVLITKTPKGKEFYQMIDVIHFELYAEKGIFVELQNPQL